MDRPVFRQRIEPPPPTWITFKRPRLWHRFYSTRERRIVTLSSGSPVLAIPVGQLRVPVIRDYDTLAFVNMTPKQVDVTMDGNIATADGVPVACRITVQLVIKDEPGAIKRVALDPAAEVGLLQTVLSAAVQERVRSVTWNTIASAGEDLTGAVEAGFASSLQQADTCFDVMSLVLSEIRPLDEDVARAQMNSLREKASAALQIELAELARKKALVDRHAEKDEAEDQLEIQHVHQRRELEIQRHQLLLAQEEEDARIARQSRLAQTLQESNAVAALVNETLDLLMRKSDAAAADESEKQALYRELGIRAQPLADVGLDAVKRFIDRHGKGA